MDFVDKHNRALLLALGGIIGVFAIIIIIFALMPVMDRATAKPRVSLNIAPTSSTITINGKDYRNGLYEMQPGTYKANVSQEGFEAKELEFTVKNNGTTIVNDYILNLSEGLEYFESSEADIVILNNIEDAEVKAFLSRFNHKKSILAELPIEGVFNMNADKEVARVDNYKYKISDGTGLSECKKIFCLYVESYKGNEKLLKEAIAKKLEEKGFDLDGYQVIYNLR